MLTGLFWSTFSLSQIPLHSTATAQTGSELSYTFYGKSIPLRLRQNVVAVSFRQVAAGRGGSRSVPLYLQLQQDLQAGSSRSRAAAPPVITVQPVGEHYALVALPANSRSGNGLAEQIQQQSYVAETLPVLALSSSEEEASSLVLPNEIIVSFEADLSARQIHTLLERQGLEIIRPLRFTQNRYLVKSTSTQGLAVLNLANRLNRQAGVQSATPNFIQALPAQQDLSLPLSEPDDLSALLAHLPQIESRYPSQLLPLAWHLNSTAQQRRGQRRTDVRATEAWQESNGGENVVVAVIDSVIQWDHPDLLQRVYTATAEDTAYELLPNEVHGWDFTSDQVTCSATPAKNCVPGDPDTRLSTAELAILRPHFQRTFQLSDQELIQEYETVAAQVQQSYPDYSTHQIAEAIRNWIRSNISAEFHGTWASGVIAAQPQQERGAIGVAPQAQILPVRVFGLHGEITSARLIEAVGYAAERGVDVINLSLGGLLPDQELTDQIFRVLDAHPKLVIVAAAGNDSSDGVAFPAAVPGVISVGATNLTGKRTFYSSYGGRLDLVAPGGETAIEQRGGILTTGGTWLAGFWQGIEPPKRAWAASLDPLGQYVQVQGTSFSAPVVAGVVALMKGVNPGLSRERTTEILQSTASYEDLSLSQADLNYYRLQSQVGLTMLQDRLSGVFPMPKPVSAQQYFYGYGLVNAEAAVKKAKRD